MKRYACMLAVLCGCNFGSMTPADTALEDGSSGYDDAVPIETTTTRGMLDLDESSGSDSGSSSDGATTDAAGSSDGSESDESSSGGEVDWAMAFDGDDEASTAPTPSAALASTFTVEAWFRAADDLTLRGVMLDSRDGAPGTVGWVMYIEKDVPHRLVFGFNGASVSASVVGPDLSSVDAGWHHVAATRDADGALTLWLDGDPVAENSDTPVPMVAAVPLRVGRFFDTAYDYWFRGVLDDIHVSSAALYSEPFEPQAPVLAEGSRLLWTFSEGEGSAFDHVDDVELLVDGATWEQR